MTSEQIPSDVGETGAEFEKARVWDVPTRVFHWVLVLTVSTGWWLGDNLSFENIQWHFYLGYATGCLVVFRVLWGFVGPRPSRFSALFFSPADVVRYALNAGKRKPSGVAGHNPIGALSVLAVLATLIVQVGTGLLSESDDFFTSGPLAEYVDTSVRQTANAVHEISAIVLLVLVAIHVSAILFYLFWKRENLIVPMLTGLKLIRKDTSS